MSGLAEPAEPGEPGPQPAGDEPAESTPPTVAAPDPQALVGDLSPAAEETNETPAITEVAEVADVEVADVAVSEPVSAPSPDPRPESEVVTPEPEPEPQPVADSTSADETAEPVAAAVAPASPPSPERSSGGTLPPPPPTPPPGSAAPPPPPGSSTPPSTADSGRIVEGAVTEVSTDEVELRLDDGRTAVINRRNFGLNEEAPSDVVSAGDRAFGAILARDDPKGRVVLSRSWALKLQAWDKLRSLHEKHESITCRVQSASAKGLVVDAGVRGFVPASHLELENPTDLSAYVGQTLELRVLEVDERKEKLVLSRRALLLKAQRKAMQERMSSLSVGEVLRGKVVSIAEYGAFIDLGGVSGLVHLSELSWYRVRKTTDVVNVGDEVDVKVLDIKLKKKRIALSIRQTTPDPIQAIEANVVLVGKVTRLVDFGAFVLIEGFEGLVHLSELAEYRVSTPEEIVAPGDEVRVKVLSVDPGRRRVELSIRRAAEFDGLPKHPGQS